MAAGEFNLDELARALKAQIDLNSAHLALAYSGGMDSQVLLHALVALRDKYNLQLRALHFDHRFDKRSAKWATQCENNCKDLGVEFICARRENEKPAGESLESFAREARYRWFADILTADEILLTAHHANDQAETVLLQLLRGGGVENLSAIREARFLTGKSNRVMRPLLNFTRTKIHSYAQQNKLNWIEDPANLQDRFDRNYIRHRIMPLIETRWAGAAQAFAASAKKCNATTEFLHSIWAANLQDCYRHHRQTLFCIAPPLAVAALAGFEKFQTISILYFYLHKHGGGVPANAQLLDFYNQVFAGGGGNAELKWREFELRVFDGCIYILRSSDVARYDLPEWNLKTQRLGSTDLMIEIARGAPQTQNGVFDLDATKLNNKKIQWAYRQGGERFTLPARAHSHSLKKVMQSKRVSTWERDYLPLLIVEDEIAWAYHLGASDKYKFIYAGDNAAALRPEFVRA